MTPAKPRRKWLRRCRVCFRWCRIAFWIALLLALWAAIYVSEVGLPDWAKDRIVAALRDQGVELEFSRMRLHWLQGVTVEEARLNVRGFPGSFTTAAAVFDLDTSRILRGRLRLEGVSLREAALVLRPSERGLAPVMVEKVRGRVSFPATNVIVLDHLEGRWRNGVFSFGAAVTNAGLFAASRPEVPPPGRPPRSLTNQLNRVVRWLEQLELRGEPTLRVMVDGDGADPTGLAASLTMTVPGADTPWGTVSNLVLHARTRDVSLPGTPDAAVVELRAGGARTRRWGDVGAFRLTAALHPADDAGREWDVRATLHAADPRFEEIALGRLEVEAETRLRVGDDWPISLSANIRAERFRSPWASVDTVSARLTRVGETNAATWSGASLGFWNRLLPHRLHAKIDATGVEARGLRLLSLGTDVDWRGPRLTLPRLEAAFASGEVSADGALDVLTREVTGAATSDFDLREARPVLTPSGLRWMDQYEWASPPAVRASGRVVLPAWDRRDVSWRDDIQPTLELGGQFHAKDVTFRGVSVNAATGIFAHTNRIWQLSDAELTRPEGKVLLDFTSEDQGGKQTFRLRSTIDPRVLLPALGPGAGKAFELVEFPNPPHLEGTLRVFRDEPERTTFHGTVAVTNARVRGIDTGTVLTGLAIEHPFIRFESPRAERGTQWVSAPLVLFDLERKLVILSNAVGQADVEAICRMIGPKVWETMEPYQFLTPPRGEANGVIATRKEDMDLTDLSFRVDDARFRWTRFTLDNVRGDVRWTGHALALTNLSATAHGGSVGGWAALDFSKNGEPRTDFRFHANAADIDLRSFLTEMGTTNRLEGLLTGSLTVTDGSNWRPSGWNGFGRASLTNGYLWDYPLFGFLTPILETVAPGVGRDKARSATGDFFITNNVIFTDNLELRAATLRLNYRGTVTFDQRLDARVEAALLRDTWLVGPVLSFVLTPFSKIFEYRVTGDLKNPKVEPVYVPGFLMRLLSPIDTLKRLLPSGQPDAPPEPPITPPVNEP